MIDQNWSPCPRYDADFMSQVKLEANLADPICSMKASFKLTSVFSRAQLAQSCLKVSRIFPLPFAHHHVILEWRRGLGDRDQSREINSRLHGTAHVSRAKEDKGDGDMEPTRVAAQAHPVNWKWPLRDDGPDVFPVCGLLAWFEVVFSPSVIPWCKGKAAGMRGPCFFHLIIAHLSVINHLILIYLHLMWTKHCSLHITSQSAIFRG